MRIQVTLTADIETDVSPSEVAYAFDRNAHQIPFQMLMTFCEVRGKYLVETASVSACEVGPPPATLERVAGGPMIDLDVEKRRL